MRNLLPTQKKSWKMGLVCFQPKTRGCEQTEHTFGVVFLATRFIFTDSINYIGAF